MSSTVTTNTGPKGDLPALERQAFIADSGGQPSKKVSMTNKLVPEHWDYMALAINSATETYTFKTGGSGGTTEATVVIVYTDSNRTDISTVTKT